MGGPHDEGAGWHMALAPSVLENLEEDFGVTCELFASPLNCTLSRYCSLFDDTDYMFCSLGSFFRFCSGDMVESGGSFECNPPFEEHLMQRAVSALLDALTLSDQPLSIVLVIPDWPASGALAAAVHAPFCQANVQITGVGHTYLNGRQHCCQPKHRVIRQTKCRGSRVVFLQNRSGKVRWPITDLKLERHRASWQEAEQAPAAKKRQLLGSSLSVD